MAATINDKFTQASLSDRPIPTTLTAAKNVADSSLSAAALVNWPTGTAVHFSLYRVGTDGKKVAGSQTDWKGIVSGTNINNLTLTSGTDDNYSIGAVVEAGPTAGWANDMVAGVTAQHAQDGTHTNVTATSLASANGLTVTAGTVALPNNSIPAQSLSMTAITLGYAQVTSNFVTTAITTAVQWTGLTTTVTIPAGGRKVKITAYCANVGTSSGASNSVFLEIWDGAVGTGTRLNYNGITILNSGYTNYSQMAVAVVTPSAGSKTYNVGVKGTISANTTWTAASDQPAFILVEAI